MPVAVLKMIVYSKTVDQVKVGDNCEDSITFIIRLIFVASDTSRRILAT